MIIQNKNFQLQLFFCQRIKCDEFWNSLKVLDLSLDILVFILTSYIFWDFSLFYLMCLAIILLILFIF